MTLLLRDDVIETPYLPKHQDGSMAAPKAHRARNAQGKEIEQVIKCWLTKPNNT